ncbi:hypothetical protein O2K51_03580 [Apibacter raozihei]|uniref:hypothetical protein n=1 Tax=Apibacter raozihei TaxID=2500547 RepID=UPI000FE360F3|nr:hypothetical protein [Apibacter raozihei]
MIKNLFKHSILITLFVSLAFSCQKNKILFKEDFQNNHNGWDTLTTSYLSNKIVDRQFISTNEFDNVINFSLIEPQIKEKNLWIESSIKFNKFYKAGSLGGLIILADNIKDPKEYLFFGINDKKEVCISRESLNPSKAQTYYMHKNENLKLDDYNTFSIHISNSKLQFLLNSKSVIAIDRIEFSTTTMGYVTLGSQIAVKDLEIKKSL